MVTDKIQTLPARTYSQRLDFSLTSKGIEVTGGTDSRAEFEAFIGRLGELVEFLPPEIVVPGMEAINGNG